MYTFGDLSTDLLATLTPRVGLALLSTAAPCCNRTSGITGTEHYCTKTSNVGSYFGRLGPIFFFFVLIFWSFSFLMGGHPGQVLSYTVCGCGVNTPRRVGTSGLHGTE